MDRTIIGRLLLVAPLLAAILAGGSGSIRAQPATPESDAEPEWLVVQAFDSATLQPDPSSGAFTLTLFGVDAAVLAFTDRPNRMVAYMPTADFAQIVAAEQADPLNAVLVSLLQDGVDAMAVVELLSATHDAVAGTVTYGVAVPATEQGALAAGDATPLPGLEAGVDFGPGHLFVDSIGMSGGAVGSPGILSGNIVNPPITVPVMICGNSVQDIAVMNPAFGSICSNPAP